MDYKEKVKLMHKQADSYARRKGCRTIFSFLIGSQNYGLDTPESDVDIVTVVVPMLEYESTHSHSEINETYEYEDGLIKLRDFRSFFLNDVVKGGPNGLEVFVSRAFIITPGYEKIIYPFLEMGEIITHTWPNESLHAAFGYAEQMRARAFKPGEKHYNPELGYNPKIFAHYMRVCDWIFGYVHDYGLEQLYSVEDNPVIKSIRHGHESLELIDKYNKVIDDYRKAYRNKVPQSDEQKQIAKDVDRMLRRMCVDIAYIAWTKRGKHSV